MQNNQVRVIVPTAQRLRLFVVAMDFFKGQLLFRNGTFSLLRHIEGYTVIVILHCGARNGVFHETVQD